MLIGLTGCVPRAEIVLSKINDDVNYNTKRKLSCYCGEESGSVS
jgi:hypothetical protein